MKREFSAGAVVYKKAASSFLFLIGKHSGYHKWVLPKGVIEEDEHGYQTALRETEEEMGVKARLVTEKPLHQVQYFYHDNKKTKIFKTVNFYLAEYEAGDPKKHGWEMEEAGWFKFDEALKKLAFDGEKEALKKARKMIK